MATSMDIGSDEVEGNVDRKCEICKDKNKTCEAQIYCKSCDKALCAMCIPVHLSQGAVGHDIVDIKQMKLWAPAINMRGMDKCETHGRLVEYFCEDHKTLCCNTCALVTGGHRTCTKFHEIDKVESEIKETEMIERMTKAKKTSDALIKHYDDTEADMTKQIKKMVDSMEEMKQKIIKMFDDTKAKVSNEARTKREEKMVLINADKTDVKTIIDETERFLKWLDAVVKKGTNVQLFIAVHRLEKTVAKYQEVIKKKQDDLCSYKFSITFNEHLTALLASSDKLGKLIFKSTPAKLPI